MPKKRTYYWLVEALDTFTRNAIADSESGFEYVGSKRCSDGKMRSLWEAADYRRIRYLYRSRHQSGYKFLVFVQEGNHPPSLWDYPWEKKAKKGGKR